MEAPEHLTVCRECKAVEAEIVHSSWGMRGDVEEERLTHYFLYVAECDYCGAAYSEEINFGEATQDELAL